MSSAMMTRMFGFCCCAAEVVIVASVANRPTQTLLMMFMVAPPGSRCPNGLDRFHRCAGRDAARNARGFRLVASLSGSGGRPNLAGRPPSYVTCVAALLVAGVTGIGLFDLIK